MDNKDSPAQPAASNTQSARGVAIITLAKAWFLLIGFAQPLILNRILSTSQYGLYASALNALSILNNVVVQGSIQSMSRSVTESGVSAVRKGLILHAVLGLVFAGTLAGISGPLGREAFKDPALPPLLAIGAIVLGNYTVYAALVGVLNGQQKFVWQASLDMTFSTVRTVLIIALAATVWKVKGAMIGFAAASAFILVLAFIAVFRALKQTEPSSAQPLSWSAFLRRYGSFFAPVLLYQLALNLVLQADLLVLKGLLGRAQTLSVDSINELTGLYKIAQNVAFLPYQLLLAVTFVAFPIVSKNTLQGDREATRSFVRSALRFSSIALGLMLAVIACLPETCIRLLYPADKISAAGALRWLALGQGAFAIAVLGTTIILAADKTFAATCLMLGMLGAVFLGDWVLIRLSHEGVQSLDAAARGTALGCVLGMVAVGIYMHRRVGAFVPLMTGLRVGAAWMVASVTGLVAWHGKLFGLVLCVASAAIFVVVLVLLGEFSADERKRVMRLIRRRLGRAEPSLGD